MSTIASATAIQPTKATKRVFLGTLGIAIKIVLLASQIAELQAVGGETIWRYQPLVKTSNARDRLSDAIAASQPGLAL